MISIDQFTYELPESLIAQSPATPRDSSRLMDVNRHSGEISHHHFYDLPGMLTANDVLVRNNTKVIPARLFGKKITGGLCEILLVKKMTTGENTWECLTKPGLKVGQTIMFPESAMTAKCVGMNEFTRSIEFHVKNTSFIQEIQTIGHIPIPPYISWDRHDETTLRKVYQTTYAKTMGSVAAPTAGLHFTPEVDQALLHKGVDILDVTLHVGLGTFLPVRDEQLQTGRLHEELYELDEETAQKLRDAKRAGKRIIAVGTTSTRVVETCARNGSIHAGKGDTDLFIQPGFRFHFVDALITNFHLPKSSLLMLVSAFTCEPNTDRPFTDFTTSVVGQAYKAAIQHEYRFFSFGDAMFIH